MLCVVLCVVFSVVLCVVLCVEYVLFGEYVVFTKLEFGVLNLECKYVLLINVLSEYIFYMQY